MTGIIGIVIVFGASLALLSFIAFRRPRAARVAAVAALLIAGIFALLPASAWARDQEQRARGQDPNGFSLGVIVGDPTGLTLRGGIGERNAIQAHFGFSPFPGDALVAQADWTYDAWDFLRNNRTASLLFYFGFGTKLEWFTGRYFAYDRAGRHNLPDRSHFGFGPRALVGLRVPFHAAPFDIFFEIAPAAFEVVVPTPGVYYDFDAAFGFRYRF